MEMPIKLYQLNSYSDQTEHEILKIKLVEGIFLYSATEISCKLKTHRTRFVSEKLRSINV